MSQDTRSHREISNDYHDPETPLNIPKVAKKSFISWAVPALCVAVLMGLVTIARSWADDRYAQKSELTEEQKKRETVTADVQEINRKLDLIIYILKHDGKIDSQTLIKP